MGRFQEKVTVIGEKEAGTDTELFWRNRTVWTAVFKELQMTVQVPIKVVLVSIAYMAPPTGNVDNGNCTLYCVRL